jgi:WD40 repeat protein
MTTLLAGMPISDMRVDWDLSPDGSRLAIIWPTERPGRIRILSLVDGTSHDVILGDWSPGRRINWSADGHGWYMSRMTAAGTDLLYVDIHGHATTLRRTTGETWAISSPDGQRLAFGQVNSTGNVWMVENF